MPGPVFFQFRVGIHDQPGQVFGHLGIHHELLQFGAEDENLVSAFICRFLDKPVDLLLEIVVLHEVNERGRGDDKSLWYCKPKAVGKFAQVGHLAPHPVGPFLVHLLKRRHHGPGGANRSRFQLGLHQGLD